MDDIRIIEYEDKMKEQVRSLFRSIYSDQPNMTEKMSYDVAMSNHVTTKIALQGDSVIGQANIFKKAELDGNANLGFHVHPEKRLQGIAKSLSIKAIETAERKGLTKLYVVTDKGNRAAIAVAGSIGFDKVDFQYVDEDMVVFMKKLRGFGQHLYGRGSQEKIVPP
jgi:RimJ/RimL family protein N-acetyltransferase